MELLKRFELYILVNIYKSKTKFEGVKMRVSLFNTRCG